MNGPTSPDEDEPETDKWWWMLDPRRNLPTRVALMAGGITIVFTLIICWITGTVFRRQLENQLGAAFENQAAQIGDKLDRGFYERYREMLFVAGLAPLSSPDTPIDERRRLLESLLRSSPDYAWLGFADPAGKVIFAAKGLLEETNAEGDVWFRSAQEKPYASDVHEEAELTYAITGGEGAPRSFLDLAMPVRSAKGQLIGVLGARVSWAVAHQVQTSVVPDTALRDRIGVTIYSSSSDVLLDTGGSGWSQPFEAPTLPDQRKSRGFFPEIIANDGLYITGYARSRGYREFLSLKWLITVRQPTSHAFAPVRELQGRIMLAGAGFTAVAMVLGWFFAVRLTDSFSGIVAATQRIIAGDVLTLMPQPRGHGEIAAMCAALGAMVNKFRQEQEKLETDNARLARLEAKAPKP